MSIVARRVKNLLDINLVCYETLPHVTDYTALETSEHTHTPGGAFAKAVLVSADGRVVMLVLPADHRIDLEETRRALGVERVRLVSEHRIRRTFPDCDTGAIPPFGNLYGLPVYICPDLHQRETLTFNAGSHEMAIRMSTKDFLRLVQPAVLQFSHHV